MASPSYGRRLFSFISRPFGVQVPSKTNITPRHNPAPHWQGPEREPGDNALTPVLWHTKADCRRQGDADLGRRHAITDDPALLKPTEIAEFLHALALHFGAVDIALAVDADEVEVVELAKLMADAAVRRHQLPVCAIAHVA